MSIMRLYFIAVFLVIGCLSGCSSSTRHAEAPVDADNSDQASSGRGEGLSLEAVLAAQGLSIVESVTCHDPGTGKDHAGYLAAFDNLFSQGTNAEGVPRGPYPKYCLVLTGSSYCMGYQMGYLRAAETAQLTNEYIYCVAERVLGLNRQDFPGLYAFLEHEIRTLCTDARSSIPDYLEEEMAGVADGARARGYDVKPENVMLLNEAFDAIYAILFTGTLPSLQALQALLDPLKADLASQGMLEELKRLEETIRIEGSAVVFPQSDPYLMGCNEFVVSGQATLDGGVYHGRDFMFYTGDMYQDYACLAVYLPEEGYPFLAVTAPGFVGQPTALNSAGLSMGMDVVKGACTRPTPGMGSLLVLRDIVQHCATLDQALEMMKQQDRGVSWLYTIASSELSPRYTYGVVVEEGRSDPPYTGPDLMPLLIQILLKPYSDRLAADPLPERGIMVRDQAWTYPIEFMDVSIGFPEGDDMTYLLYFPTQGETWPDVVLAANNYIIPRMVFTTYTPLIALNGGLLRKAPDRYNLLLELTAAAYGQISFDEARALIDFLNPNRGLDKKQRYTIGGPVEGHHAIIDNRNRIVEALFGYYGDWQAQVPDSWVRLDLKPFVLYRENARR